MTVYPGFYMRRRQTYLPATVSDMAQPAWMAAAACVGLDPEIFFAGDGSGAVAQVGGSEYERARQVCSTCPVAAECLDYAQAAEPHGQRLRYGMYGGHTPRERWLLRNHRTPV